MYHANNILCLLKHTGYHNVQDIFILFLRIKKIFYYKILNVFCLDIIYIISISSILFKKSKI